MLKRITVLSFALFVSHVVYATTNSDEWAVENETVQVRELELRTITKALLKSGQIRKEGLSAENLEKVAKNFMLYKALAQHAQDIGLDKTPEVQKLVEINQQRVLGEVYLTHYLDKLDTPNFESVALENYKLNKNQFVQPEMISAQHILIHFGDDESESQAKAKSVRDNVLEAKQSFADLAKEYSNDPSAQKNGGNLGTFNRSEMVPEFSKAAFELKVGEVSQPVKTQFGWHIIQVLEKKPAKVKDFSKVKKDLIRTAEQNFKNNARNQKLSETVYTPNLKVNENLIKKLADEFLSE